MEAKKALFNISKLLPQCPFPFTSRACLSTSYQHPQGSNAGVEGMYQVKTREGQPQSPPQQDSRTAEDSAKEGIKRGWRWQKTWEIVLRRPWMELGKQPKILQKS
ncbi:hypothetical protein ES332_A04G045500v1 [Gossypium tomentosum]|uniref:Uncharacterized protein n=1 Tax=Gossypium tomentosum TaxID=34277 RepID=A0A5D2QUW8_GOSTO|nr:hypothetical protein ES332_A04G045500v1 [Gossypium tomentosum]